MSREQTTVKVDVEIKRNRPNEDAVLVSDGDQDVWIPRSQIKDQEDDDLEEGEDTSIWIPEWLAINKGLV